MSKQALAVMVLGLGLSVASAYAGDLVVTQKIDQDTFAGTDALGIVASADGQFVYLGGRGVYVFARDPLDGTLTQIQTIDRSTPGVTGIDRVQSLALSPDQRFLYAASFNEAIVVLERDTGTGLLTFVEAITEDPATYPTAPQAVAVSADGRHLYSSRDEAVMAFARNSVSGALLHLQTVLDDLGPAHHLDSARGITTGNVNDSIVLVTSASEESLTLFLRDLGTGLLTFMSDVTDEVVLRTAGQVILSPDDAHIYVATREGVAHYTFVLTPPSTIGLALVDFVSDERLLSLVRGLAITPDGTRVYAVNTQGWVTLLERDTGTGTLAIGSAAQIEDDATGVAVVGNGDAAHVYATGQSDQGIDIVAALRHVGLLCPPVASATCKASTRPTASLLSLIDGDSTDSLTWKWKFGEPTTLGEFGDLVSGTDDLAFCLYADGGSTLLTTTHIPAGGVCLAKECWQTRTTKVAYWNRTLAPDGVHRATLVPGPTEKAQITIKGKGRAFPNVASFLVLPSLPLATPVVAQLHAATGTCWSTTHGAPSRNDERRFKANAD